MSSSNLGMKPLRSMETHWNEAPFSRSHWYESWRLEAIRNQLPP